MRAGRWRAGRKRWLNERKADLRRQLVVRDLAVDHMAGRLGNSEPLHIADCFIRLGNDATHASSMLLLYDPVSLGSS